MGPIRVVGNYTTDLLRIQLENTRKILANTNILLPMDHQLARWTMKCSDVKI